jgi:lipoprotein NlpI
MAYGEKGDFESAIGDFTKTIELKPDYPEAYYYRGISYANKDEVGPAMDDFQMATKLKPDFIAAHGNLNRIVSTL